MPAFPCSGLCQEDRTKASSKGRIYNPACASPGCGSDGLPAPVLGEPWVLPDPPLITSPMFQSHLMASSPCKTATFQKLPCEPCNQYYLFLFLEKMGSGQIGTLDHPSKAHCDAGVERPSIVSGLTQVCAGEISYPEAARELLQASVPDSYSLRKTRPDPRHLALTGFSHTTTRGPGCISWCFHFPPSSPAVA